jgi:hypothetical protein
MSIRIAFTNPNNADTIKVYRATSKIELSALPDPIATLAGTATSFSDVTAARNTVYYYVIGSYKGDDVIFTQNQQYGYFPDTGPGPSKLLRGNWNEGYFGTCTQAELFAAQELCTALGYVPNGAVNTTASNVWHKFILDGKILFIPDLCMAADGWLYIYRAGLVYGVDGYGDRPASFSGGNYNQKKTVTKNNRTYLVRLMKATAAPTSELVTDLTNGDARWGEGEWNRTMGRLGCGTYNFSTRSRLGNKPVYSTNNTLFTGALTQHMTANGTIVQMFATLASDVPSTVAWSSNYYNWRPVLELQL